MLYLGMNLPQTLLDVAVSDEEASLRTGIFRFASELRGSAPRVLRRTSEAYMR
jgi:hypothetical protein